ncbi:MAG: cytochrome c, partial [Gemmatimonadota bacterium]
MWKTNLKIVATVLITLGVYTGISNVIPQVESQVPERVEVGPNTSTQELIAMGEKIFHGAGGCEACHGLGTRAPTLLGEIGNRCGQRQPELSCKEYLHRSLTEPRDFVVEGFQPIMPDMSAQLSPGQIWALVAFLQSQGGEVTV